jgi:hypothetical protein
MTSELAGSSGRANGGESGGTNWLTAVASLIVGAGFLGLWFWLLPGVAGI